MRVPPLAHSSSTVGRCCGGAAECRQQKTSKKLLLRPPFDETLEQALESLIAVRGIN
jgi:hypothetical protein